MLERSEHSLFSGVRAAVRQAAEEAIVCRMGSSLVAVMVQATAHCATHVWVADEQEGEERELVGVVGLLDVLWVLRHHLQHPRPMIPSSGEPDGQMNQPVSGSLFMYCY